MSHQNPDIRIRLIRRDLDDTITIVSDFVKTFPEELIDNFIRGDIESVMDAERALLLSIDTKKTLHIDRIKNPLGNR